MTDLADTAAARALIDLARAGEESAFEMLLGAHRRALLAFISAELRDPVDAEDVLQEVLFRAWRGLATYEHRGRFVGWIFTIAYREIATFRRGVRARHARSDALRVAPVVHAFSPHDELEADETGKRIRAVIAELPPRQRHVFVMRHTTALTFAEISEATGEPLNTVLSHMHYAMKKLGTAVKSDA